MTARLHFNQTPRSASAALGAPRVSCGTPMGHRVSPAPLLPVLKCASKHEEDRNKSQIRDSVQNNWLVGSTAPRTSETKNGRAILDQIRVQTRQLHAVSGYRHANCMQCPGTDTPNAYNVQIQIRPWAKIQNQQQRQRFFLLLHRTLGSDKGLG